MDCAQRERIAELKVDLEMGTDGFPLSQCWIEMVSNLLLIPTFGSFTP